MAASHGIFAIENPPLELSFLIEHFKNQHDAYCKAMDLPTQNIHYKLLKPTSLYPFPHYKISLGEQFSGSLIAFFQNKGIKVSIGTSNAIFISKEELKNAKLTYKDGQEFLFFLHQTIQAEQSSMSRSLDALKK